MCCMYLFEILYADRCHMHVLCTCMLKCLACFHSVLNEADYQKSKEIAFHQETENMNRGATWWPMMQVRDVKRIWISFV